MDKLFLEVIPDLDDGGVPVKQFNPFKYLPDNLTSIFSFAGSKIKGARVTYFHFLTLGGVDVDHFKRLVSQVPAKLHDLEVA